MFWNDNKWLESWFLNTHKQVRQRPITSKNIAALRWQISPSPSLSLSPHSQSLSSNGWGYTAKEDLGARSVCFFSSLVCFRSLPPGFPHELLIPALVLRMRRICLWGRRNKGRENKEQQGGKFYKREWAKRSFLFLQAQARLVREASCYWNKQCLLLLFYVYYLVSFLTRHIQNISLPPLELQLTVPAEHFSKLRTFYFFKSA